MAYFDPNFHSLEEYTVPPPTVSVDNDTYRDRTVVKVNGVNRHGILVDIVQSLTDLDLIISKSNITVDGEWMMDAFHVTDELGNKLTEPSHIRYITDSLMFAERRGGENCRPPAEVRTCLNNLIGAGHLSSDYTMVEMTATDHPGLLSDVLATLLDFTFEVKSAVAWAHNARAGFIFHGTVLSPEQTMLEDLKLRLKRVVEACGSEKWRLGISGPLAGRTQSAERRLHQIMREEIDWEQGRESRAAALSSETVVTAVEMEVSVNNKKKCNYMVEVNVRSRDRAKLLYDVVCTLADMDYSVVYASVSTEGKVAVHEYYVKKREGRSRVTEKEKGELMECLKAGIERRAGPWGMRVKVRSLEYRRSLLWEVTRVVGDNGMVVEGAKWEKQGDGLAIGEFYVKKGRGSSSGGLMQALRKEIGGCDFEIRELQ